MNPDDEAFISKRNRKKTDNNFRVIPRMIKNGTINEPMNTPANDGSPKVPLSLFSKIAFA